ncbi:MAG: hypothetical protein NTX06_10120, partial [Proteobacteria bacterium]|nr:hypothetical protein [Pseudomonadota bacterium]
VRPGGSEGLVYGRFNGPDQEILVGFGQGGQGMMELHDDGLHDFSIISRLLIPDDNYNIVNGEAYPAIKNTKSDFSRIMNFFLQSLSKKKLRQP